MSAARPIDLDAFWMPFTANRQFKANPRLLARAEGIYYWTPEGRQVLDGASGLWCVNAGHGRTEITAAVAKQVAEMDYAPPFQMGHPIAFELANALVEISPPGLDRVFFTNSGSEAVDTALKIAIAYHRARGEGQRHRLIGRERAYHGVGFGGISVGGMVANRRTFGPMLPGVDHLRHTLDLERNAFARGQPQHGKELADDLERLCALHDPSTIAAVIVEPVAGSVGVYPPPVGYLERLREISEKHGILLIFDEVITAWGRLGYASAAERFGIVPDMITMAKGLTSAHVPMGAVVCRDGIYEAFMKGPEYMIGLFHGYTYSGHPLAAVAGLATLEAYKEEGIFEQVRELEPYFEDALHSCRDLPGVKDIRNLGLMGAIELEPLAGQPGKRGFELMIACYERGLMVRMAMETFEFSPPLIATREDIDRIFEIVRTTVRQTG